MFPKLIALVGVLLLLVLLVMTIMLLAADAKRRGKPALLVVLLAMASFPLGLLLWLVFRPEPLESRKRQFRLGNHRMQ
jgi:uncharacterized membrane protein